MSAQRAGATRWRRRFAITYPLQPYRFLPILLNLPRSRAMSPLIPGVEQCPLNSPQLAIRLGTFLVSRRASLMPLPGTEGASGVLAEAFMEMRLTDKERSRMQGMVKRPRSRKQFYRAEALLALDEGRP